MSSSTGVETVNEHDSSAHVGVPEPNVGSQSTRRFKLRWLIIVALVIAAPFFTESDITLPMGLPTSAWLPVFNLALIAIIGAASFDLLVAYTGQLSFAHAAFLMLGTSVAGAMGVKQDISLLYVLVACLISGAVLGVIVGLPALRLRGLYLALATLAIYFFFLRGYQIFQRRHFGFSGIIFPDPRVSLTPTNDGPGVDIDSNFRWYWFLLIVSGLSVLFMRNVIRSRIGRSFAAVRHHDLSAGSLGVPVMRVKLTAFAVSSAFVTMAGGLLGYYLTAREATSYSIVDTLNYASMVVVGGLSSTAGVVLGALFFYAFPVVADWALENVPIISSNEFLRIHKSALQLGVFGVATVIVLVFFPEGLIGIVRRCSARLGLLASAVRRKISRS